MKIVNVFAAAACVCAAESAFAVIAARATRTVGAGCVEESGTNVPYSITYCKNIKLVVPLVPLVILTY